MSLVLPECPARAPFVCFFIDSVMPTIPLPFLSSCSGAPAFFLDTYYQQMNEIIGSIYMKVWNILFQMFNVTTGSKSHHWLMCRQWKLNVSAWCWPWNVAFLHYSVLHLLMRNLIYCKFKSLNHNVTIRELKCSMVNIRKTQGCLNVT